MTNVHGSNQFKKCDLCSAYSKYLNKHKKICLYWENWIY